jgi:DnaJ-class molecular chaperone
MSGSIGAYYTLLGVQRTCTTTDIKKGFRKMALKHHPDKSNGSTDMFQKINEANDVLSNPDSRKMYDMHGKHWKKYSDMSQGNRGHGPGVQRGGGSARVCENITHNITISLDDAYNGKTKKLKITRKEVCSTCTGYGTKNKRPSECGVCEYGVRQVVRKLGPMMVQQFSIACDLCNGTGVQIAPTNRCTDCNASGTIKGYHIIDVSIPRGISDKTQLMFNGAADQRRGYVSGNVVIMIHVSNSHTTFRRNGSDLHQKISISLLEALIGFKRVIHHLDGRLLLIEHSLVVQPGDKMVIRNEGMPVESTSNTGDLIIYFEIEFPKQLDVSSTKQLKDLLGQDTTDPTQTELDGATNANIEPYTLSQEPRNRGSNRNTNNGHQQTQECRQM